MKRIFTFAAVFALLAQAGVVRAADPFEEYDLFVPTDRGNTEYETLCREELGYDPDQTIRVAAQLYNLRRCINLKRLQVDGHQALIGRQRTIRRAHEAQQASSRIKKLQRQIEKGRQRKKSQYFDRRISFREKNPTQAGRERLRQERIRMRQAVRQREDERDALLQQKKTSRDSITDACIDVPLSSRRHCIWMQIHNLNLLNQ